MFSFCFKCKLDLCVTSRCLTCSPACPRVVISPLSAEVLYAIRNTLCVGCCRKWDLWCAVCLTAWGVERGRSQRGEKHCRMEGEGDEYNENGKWKWERRQNERDMGEGMRQMGELAGEQGA